MRTGTEAGRGQGGLPVRGTVGRAGRVLVLLAAGVLSLSACQKKQFKVTECVDGRPVVERTLDVAPPNC